MINNGFFRAAAISPEVKPGDISFNCKSIKDCLESTKDKCVDFCVLTELSLTGYTCADLFQQTLLLERTLSAIEDLKNFSNYFTTPFAVGAPLRHNGVVYNCAVLFAKGEILGVVPKSYLPNYAEFYEKRWFSSGMGIKDEHILIDNQEIPFGTDILFRIGNATLGIEICEDLWVPVSPGAIASVNGADVIANLSASDELIGKNNYLSDLIRIHSASCRCGYIYASAGVGESSTDLVFSGKTIIAENGVILQHNQSTIEHKDRNISIADIDIERLLNDRARHNSFFDNSLKQNYRIVSSTHIPCRKEDICREIPSLPFVNKNVENRKRDCEEISGIQARGLAQRLRSIGCRNAVIGISGGLDSTLALLVTVKAFDMLGIDRKGILAVTMPGFGTTGRTYNNALKLMEELGVSIREINIADAVNLHFRDIGHNPAVMDATYENSQARERTQILMDLANQTNGIVIGTGDLSELALGWCTYNGDQISMYGVNASIPKTLVKYLVEGYAETPGFADVRSTLLDIIDTPISPELLPADAKGDIAQKTEDLVGPYELHDFFIYYMLRHGFAPEKIFRLAKVAFEGKYDDATILKWLRTFYRRFFSQQFKRSCMPDGPKVGSICLSPRGDWRMPSDASANIWLRDVDNLISEH